MDIQELQDYLAPNGSDSQVTLYKSSTSDTLCFKNKRGIIIPVGSGGGVVNKNMSATGTTAANTKTILTYGVNVFTNVSNTAYAAKLPTPVTGQSVVVVNNSGATLTLYPSTTGGKINGVVNGSAIIPPDGKAYTFYCIENPLPGEWTWDAPAIGQFDSGLISMTLTSVNTSGDNPLISAYNDTIKTIIPMLSNNSAGYNGKNLPIVLGVPNNNTYPIYFRPEIPWNSVTKIKVYTNATANSLYYFQINGELDYYNISTNVIATNGPSVAGAFAWNAVTDKTIPGTAITTGDVIQPYVGAPGTKWGELVFPNPVMTYPGTDTVFSSSKVGNVDYGNQIYPYTYPAQYIGQLVNAFYSAYASFMMQPMWNNNYGTKTFQFKFIIEYT
jgi:hypothetical protein